MLFIKQKKAQILHFTTHWNSPQAEECVFLCCSHAVYLFSPILMTQDLQEFVSEVEKEYNSIMSVFTCKPKALSAGSVCSKLMKHFVLQSHVGRNNLSSFGTVSRFGTNRSVCPYQANGDLLIIHMWHARSSLDQFLFVLQLLSL